MTNRSTLTKYAVPALCLMLFAAGAPGQDLPVILQVDVENQVRYTEDVTDRSLIARSPVPVASTPAANFNRGVVISDITAVNGTPAKGAMVNLVNDLRLSPSGAPGTAKVVAQASAEDGPSPARLTARTS